jgi:hypothetical protein
MGDLAYAKLWGRHNSREICRFVTALPAKIGRASSAQAPDASFIDLGSEAKASACKNNAHMHLWSDSLVATLHRWHWPLLK